VVPPHWDNLHSAYICNAVQGRIRSINRNFSTIVVHFQMSVIAMHSTWSLESARSRHFDHHPAGIRDKVAIIVPEHVNANHDEMGTPPNGGSKAWLQVLGSWMLSFNTWGIVNTYSS
jgi:hypothetical protein